MNKLNISTRLLILISVLSALLIGIGAIGLYGIVRADDSLQTVYADRTVPLGQLDDISYLMQHNRVLVMDMLLQPVAQNVAKRNQELRANIDTITKVWAAYMATYLTPEEATLARAFDQDRNAYLQQALLPAADAMLAGQGEAALALYIGKVSPLAPPIQQGIKKLSQLQIDVAKSEFDAATSLYTTIRAVSVAAIVLGVLFAFIFGLALSRGISRALRQALDATRAVAQGDLSHAIAVQGQDEVAQVLLALSDMQQSLSKVVTNVRQGTEGVSTASAQIAAGNQDLSARTESQASALQQTAASM
ncbi:MAG: methyl-accepting chemotaxis protein [Rhodoferax sp.]